MSVPIQKPPFENGVQFAFAIGISQDALTHQPPDGAATVVSAPQRDDWMKVLRVYVTEPGLTQEHLGLRHYELVPPSPLRLASGRGVWVVATEEEGTALPDPSLGPPIGSAVMFIDYGPDDINAPGLMQVGVRWSQA